MTEDLVSRALSFATYKHKDQKRKNLKGDDYIVHPNEVMQFLRDGGITDEYMLSAALLHDTIEDTDTTHKEIMDLFGKEVADMVQEVTDDKSLPKATRKKLQAENIKEKSFGARMIKLGDKWSNTKDLLIDPPRGWSITDIYGYILWSEKVCNNAMLVGDTPTKIETFIKEHFDAIHSTLLVRTTLEEYYDNMK